MGRRTCPPYWPRGGFGFGVGQLLSVSLRAARRHRPVRQILVAAGLALAVALLLTPVLIQVFTRRGLGQPIRDEAPESHQRKQGTPTMGGLAIITAIWASYLGTHLIGLTLGGEGPSASGLLVLGLATALGAVGFADDYVKLRRSRNLGLNRGPRAPDNSLRQSFSGYSPCSSATPMISLPAASNCPMCATSPRSPCRRWCSWCSA